MNLITTLVIAIATSLTGVSAVSSLRGVADTFEDQVAVALGGHRKQDCVDNCQYWWGVSKQSCKDCCKQGGNTCDPETLGGTRYVNTCIADNETPEPTPSPVEPVGQMCDGQRRPECGSGQAGTRQETAKCCPNDFGSFEYECVYVGESCPAPTPAPVEPVGQMCDGQRRPQCGSGQAGTRQETAKC